MLFLVSELFIGVYQKIIHLCPSWLPNWGDVSIDADALPLWLSDGNVLIEAPAHIQFPDT